MSKNPKIELIKAIMQIEGNLTISSTGYNYDNKGGVLFRAYKKVDSNFENISIAMDKSQVEAVNDCNSVLEIYDCYKEMEYF